MIASFDVFLLGYQIQDDERARLSCYRGVAEWEILVRSKLGFIETAQ